MSVNVVLKVEWDEVYEVLQRQEKTRQDKANRDAR